VLEFAWHGQEAARNRRRGQVWARNPHPLRSS
jgi:hypothetical protein